MSYLSIRVRHARPAGPLLPAVPAVLMALYTMSAGALEPTQIYELGRAQVVAVQAYDSTSKVAAMGNGLGVTATDIVTNCHLVRSAQRLEVVHEGERRAARLEHEDLERNLCQLALESPLTRLLPVKRMRPSGEIKPGQSAYVISVSPDGDRVIQRGMISGLKARNASADKLVLMDIPIGPTASGSALYDEEGVLLGINVAGVADSRNQNIALPTEWIRELPARGTAIKAQIPEARAAAESASVKKEAATRLIDVLRGARYQYRMSSAGRSLGLVTVEVLSVEGDKVRERVTREGYAAFRQERVVYAVTAPDAFQPVVTLPGGYQLPELIPYIQRGAELKVGQSWTSVTGDYFLPRFGKRKLPTDVRVAGKETIVVPAGQFETWRVETLSEVLTYDTSPFRVKCIFWQPTNGSRTVKMVVEVLANLEIARSKDQFELIRYDPGQ